MKCLDTKWKHNSIFDFTLRKNLTNDNVVVKNDNFSFKTHISILREISPTFKQLFEGDHDSLMYTLYVPDITDITLKWLQKLIYKRPKDRWSLQFFQSEISRGDFEAYFKLMSKYDITIVKDTFRQWLDMADDIDQASLEHFWEVIQRHRLHEFNEIGRRLRNLKKNKTTRIRA